jgi:hypothetical protein
MSLHKNLKIITLKIKPIPVDSHECASLSQSNDEHEFRVLDNKVLQENIFK